MSEPINLNTPAVNPQIKNTDLNKALERTTQKAAVIDFKSDDAKESKAPITGLEIEKAGGSDAATDDVPELKGANVKPAEPEIYEVRKGDSLWKISRDQLRKTNPGKEPTNAEIIDMMQQISDANNLDYKKDGKYKTIHPGDKLEMPNGKTAEEPAESGAPKKSPEPTELPKNDDNLIHSETRELTPEERSKARHYGSNVSDYLVGWTDDSEKGLTKEVITKQVNNKNVMDFLAGYEANRGLGDHFFVQLGSEYGFEEKQNLIKDVALKLSVYLKNNGQPHLAREVDVALQDNGVSKKELEKLDKIVRTVLTDIPGLKI